MVFRTITLQREYCDACNKLIDKSKKRVEIKSPAIGFSKGKGRENSVEIFKPGVYHTHCLILIAKKKIAPIREE